MKDLSRIQKASLLIAVAFVMLVLLKSLNSPSHSSPAGWGLPPAEWGPTCEKYVADSRAAGMTGAKPLPPVDTSKPPPPVWLLSWAGVTVPIPAVPFDEVILDHGPREGLMELTLRTREPRTSVELRWQPADEPIRQYWPQDLRDVCDAPDGKAAWDDAFGDHFLTRAHWWARQHTLDEVTCSKERIAQDLPILLSTGAFSAQLSFGPPNPKFDITNPGILGGTAEHQGVGRWSIVLLPLDVTTPPAEIRYELLERYDVLGNHVGNSALTSVGDQPLWFAPMAQLLTRLDQEGIDALLDAFNRSGVAPSSRLGLAELQRIVDGEKSWGETSPHRKVETRQKNEVVF